MTPLERAARALYDATRPVRYRRDCTQPHLPPVEVPYTRDGWVDWSELPEEKRAAWCAKARAVIKAIREPSEIMERAGMAACGGDGSALDAYEAMIDALLEV